MVVGQNVRDIDKTAGRLCVTVLAMKVDVAGNGTAAGFDDSAV